MTADSQTSSPPSWTALGGLARRLGQRFGFAAVRLSPTDVALFGGVVHYDTAGSLGHPNPVPFSQVHCVGPLSSNPINPFTCSLLSIRPASNLPSPRLYHSGTRLESDAVIVLGGQAFGDPGKKLSDIWCLELSPVGDSDSDSRHAGEWFELTPAATPAARSSAFPPPRCMHACAAVGSSGLIVSGGSGFEETVLGDLWAGQIDVHAKSVVWRRANFANGPAPSPRKAHALSPLISDSELLLHGGIDAAGQTLSDLWLVQFMNEDRTRCVWTQLVDAPAPRASGHILFASGREVLVFGGSAASAARYSLDTGVWTSSECPAPDSLSYSAVAVDVLFESPPSEDAMEDTSSVFGIPSVLLLADNVSRSTLASPLLASLFVGEVQPASTPKQSAPSETEVRARREAYAKLAANLPCLPESSFPLEITKRLGTPTRNFQPHFVLHTVDYLRSVVFGHPSSVVSCSSWSGGNPNTSHVLVTSASFCDDSLDSMKHVVNDPNTVAAIAQTCNSCLIVRTTTTGDRQIAFVSEALMRHAGEVSHSPVVSVHTSSYADVQATLRLLMAYTPFRTPSAIADLFALFPACGFLLIDFDAADSENTVPTLAKPVSAKDPYAFWYEALKSLQSARARLQAYPATYLHEMNISVNALSPSVSLFSCLKSKLLAKPVEGKVPKVGHVLIGHLKDAPPLGVLLYSNGVLIRNLLGRFPYTGDTDGDDELISAIGDATAFVDVGDAFTPFCGGLSDFADTDSAEWAQLLTRCAEMCLGYAANGTLII